MVVIRFSNKTYEKVNNLNYDMNLSLIGSEGFINNEIAVGPVKYDSSTELYYYDLLVGYSGGVNLMIEPDGMRINKLSEER